MDEPGSKSVQGGEPTGTQAGRLAVRRGQRYATRHACQASWYPARDLNPQSAYAAHRQASKSTRRRRKVFELVNVWATISTIRIVLLGSVGSPALVASPQVTCGDFGRIRPPGVAEARGDFPTGIAAVGQSGHSSRTFDSMPCLATTRLSRFSPARSAALRDCRESCSLHQRAHRAACSDSPKPLDFRLRGDEPECGPTTGLNSALEPLARLCLVAAQ